MPELEIVLEDPRDPACLEAVGIARAVFGRVTSDIRVTDRPFGEREEASLYNASPSEALFEMGIRDSRFVDLREFTLVQAVGRSEFRVPDSKKTMTLITSKRSAVVQDDFVEPLFTSRGFANRNLSEGVVVTREITRSLITPKELKLAGLLIAFTLVHEAGHIFGQVPDESSRNSDGEGHCKKRCVMRTTPNNDETLRVIRKMKEDRGHRICFCSGCKEGIRSQAKSRRS